MSTGTHHLAGTTGAVPAGDPGAPALELTHVNAGYGPYRALFDVSFSVPAASVVALLGANGAGKSTVARVATGLLPLTGARSGSTVPVTGQAAYRVARAGVAHVPEGRGVFANLTVEENLTLAFRQRGGRRTVSDSLARAYEAFPVLGERRRQRGGTLSGGQQRLLSLAKVLIVPPRLLIADELSLGLAPVVIEAVYEGLRSIHQTGTALLVVEQQIDRVLSTGRPARWCSSTARWPTTGHPTAPPRRWRRCSPPAATAWRWRTPRRAGETSHPRRPPRPPAGGGPGPAGVLRTRETGNHEQHSRTGDRRRAADHARQAGRGPLHLAPGRPAGLRPRPAGGADRGGPVPGRRRDRRLRHPGGRAEHQRHPQRLGGGRAAPGGAGHHRRPPVRFLPAGHALRGGRGGGGPLRPGHRLRGGGHEPGAARLQRPRRHRPLPPVLSRGRRRPPVGAVPGGPAAGRPMGYQPRGHGPLRPGESSSGRRRLGQRPLRQGGRRGAAEGRGRLADRRVPARGRGHPQNRHHGGPGQAAPRPELGA